jgi:hypothetical protein
VCDASIDVVFTYDFALKKDLELQGIEVYFLDHLLDNKVMQKNNFLIYKFFERWHYDAHDNDIFTYKGIPFGFSLRLEFWSDYTEYIRLYIALKRISLLQSEKIYVGMKNLYIENILNILKIESIAIDIYFEKQKNVYFFAINKWMDEQIRPTGLRGMKYKLREYVSLMHVKLMSMYDRFFKNKNKQNVFIQEYHPTREIVAKLKKDDIVQVVLSHMEKRSSLINYVAERYLPMHSLNASHKKSAKKILEDFILNRTHTLVLEDGSDITEPIYEIIVKRLESRLRYSVRTLDASIEFLEKNKLDLIVLIANMGHIPTLLHRACEVKGIPSFLIINGLLGPEYLDEGKHATYINAYSESIKKHYFKGMDNIVTLGDPRMDMYLETETKSHINREVPTVVIGASGFNSVDLNSYVAVEFDFMYDILTVLSRVKKAGHALKVILKIRPNGYRKQYEDFIQEYFFGIVDSIEDTIPMKDVLLKADLYISIYSQTLFEASCLGVPVIYYKKDSEIMDTPFDGKSELVTACNERELEKAFYDFKAGDSRYNAFLDRSIMEKYVGYLDGKNLMRNVDYIYALLGEEH